jgi:hypothetical protein
VAVLCALLLALPGQTITTKYVNDLFVFLDGAHRVLLGHVPNRDFHSALGPLTYGIPAAGLLIGGSYGAAMPIGMALTVLVLALPAAHILRWRLRPAIAVPLGLYFLTLASVPINLGEPIRALSFAMFYNRVGWAALGFLLVMYIRPKRASFSQDVLDTLSASILTLVMIYLKISYGLVAIAFLGFMLSDPRQRRWAAASLGLIATVCLGVEALWRASASYLSDLMLAARVSGGITDLEELGPLFVRTLAGYVLFGLVIALVLRRRRHVRDVLFYGFCCVTGLLLLKQNFNNWEVATLGAAAAVGLELASRSGPDRGWPTIVAGLPVLLLPIVLPSVVHNGAALGLHAALASLQYGEPVQLSQFGGIRLARLWEEGDHPAMKAYLASLEDGAQALRSLDREPGRVLVLDFVGPFSAGLGLETPKGDSTWHHWGRTLDEGNFIPAERLLANVDVVMEPKLPIEVWTAAGLSKVYGSYVAEHFALTRETQFWRVHLAKNAVPREPVHGASNRRADPVR